MLSILYIISSGIYLNPIVSFRQKSNAPSIIPNREFKTKNFARFHSPCAPIIPCPTHLYHHSSIIQIAGPQSAAIIAEQHQAIIAVVLGILSRRCRVVVVKHHDWPRLPRLSRLVHTAALLPQRVALVDDEG